MKGDSKKDLIKKLQERKKEKPNKRIENWKLDEETIQKYQISKEFIKAYEFYWNNRDDLIKKYNEKYIILGENGILEIADTLEEIYKIIKEKKYENICMKRVGDDKIQSLKNFRIQPFYFL